MCNFRFYSDFTFYNFFPLNTKGFRVSPEQKWRLRRIWMPSNSVRRRFSTLAPKGGQYTLWEWRKWPITWLLLQLPVYIFLNFNFPNHPFKTLYDYQYNENLHTVQIYIYVVFEFYILVPDLSAGNFHHEAIMTSSPQDGSTIPASWHHRNLLPPSVLISNYFYKLHSFSFLSNWRLMSTANSNMLVSKLTPQLAFGCQISGISLQDNVKSEDIASIRKCLEDHKLVLIRNNNTLTESRQEQIAEWFGDLETAGFELHKNTSSDFVLRVSNHPSEGLQNFGTSGFHIDCSFLPQPKFCFPIPHDPGIQRWIYRYHLLSGIHVAPQQSKCLWLQCSLKELNEHTYQQNPSIGSYR